MAKFDADVADVEENDIPVESGIEGDDADLATDPDRGTSPDEAIKRLNESVERGLRQLAKDQLAIEKELERKARLAAEQAAEDERYRKLREALNGSPAPTPAPAPAADEESEAEEPKPEPSSEPFEKTGPAVWFHDNGKEEVVNVIGFTTDGGVTIALTESGHKPVFSELVFLDAMEPEVRKKYEAKVSKSEPKPAPPEPPAPEEDLPLHVRIAKALTKQRRSNVPIGQRLKAFGKSWTVSPPNRKG